MEIKFFENNASQNVDTKFIYESINNYVKSGKYPKNLLLEKLIYEEKIKEKNLDDLNTKSNQINEKMNNLKNNYKKLKTANDENIIKLISIL